MIVSSILYFYLQLGEDRGFVWQKFGSEICEFISEKEIKFSVRCYLLLYLRCKKLTCYTKLIIIKVFWQIQNQHFSKVLPDLLENQDRNRLELYRSYLLYISLLTERTIEFIEIVLLLLL